MLYQSMYPEEKQMAKLLYSQALIFLSIFLMSSLLVGGLEESDIVVKLDLQMFNDYHDNTVLRTSCYLDSVFFGNGTIGRYGAWIWFIPRSRSSGKLFQCQVTFDGAPNTFRFDAYDKNRDSCMRHCEWTFRHDGVYHRVDGEGSNWRFTYSWPR